jgi:hypothetical protein
MVLNLIDIVVGREGLWELNDEYSHWSPEHPKVRQGSHFIILYARVTRAGSGI